jgi:hypothetical protein
VGYLRQYEKQVRSTKIFEAELIQRVKKFYASTPQTFNLILRVFKDAAKNSNQSPSRSTQVCFTKVAIVFGKTNLSPSYDINRVWDRINKVFPDPTEVMQKKCLGTFFLWAMAEMCEDLDEYWICWAEPDSGIYDLATGKEVAVNCYFKSAKTRPNIPLAINKLGEKWGAKIS